VQRYGRTVDGRRNPGLPLSRKNYRRKRHAAGQQKAAGESYLFSVFFYRRTGSREVLGILLLHNTHPIDEYFLKIAVQMGGGEGVRCLLSYYTNLIISEDIMLEAAKSTSVLKVLLSQEKHVEVTAQVIEAVLSQQQPDPGTIKLLLERSGELAIAEDILVVAAEGDCKGAPITQILLGYQETVITQRLVEGALRNRNHTLDLLHVFLSHGRKAPLHQEVTDAAYTAHENNSEVMEILADFGYSIPTKNPTPQLKLEEGAFLPRLRRKFVPPVTI
jgi:hypothetical protein